LTKRTALFFDRKEIKRHISAGDVERAEPVMEDAQLPLDAPVIAGKSSSVARRPCLKAFMRERSLPWGVLAMMLN
jgi:hypothetical protein